MINKKDHERILKKRDYYMKEFKSFRDLGLSEESLAVLEKKGFEKPSPIQSSAIPILLNKENDIIGQAQTGTGKTAAFGLPIIEMLDDDIENIQALILAPTRELAIQVSDEINSFKGNRDFKVIPIYGGQHIIEQIRHLKKGVQIVVGTPGRILDHLRRKTLNLKSISFLVLDEADEMLNMGFIEDVEQIMAACNKDKQVALFSATIPDQIEALVSKYMRKVKRVVLKKKQITTDLIEQIYFEVKEQDKFEALCRIIDIEEEFYGLIFCRTKVDVDQYAGRLIERGYDAEAIHGDVTQKQRENVLKKFRSRRVNILVATDVAARGLDITDLTHVINLSLPQEAEGYVHRIGRTGRAGKKGVAITFITPSEYRKLAYIQRIAKTDIKREKIPEIAEIISIKRSRLTKEIVGQIQTGELQEFEAMTEALTAKYDSSEIIPALLKMIVQDRLDENKYAEIAQPSSSPDMKGKTRLFIGLGKREGYNAKNLVAFIKQKTGLKDKDIEDVTLRDDFSFIAVPFQEAEKIVKQFKEKAKGRKPLIVKATSDDQKKKKNTEKESRKIKNPWKGKPSRNKQRHK
jgi:ATP-dependent RNA helicase DeaD